MPDITTRHFPEAELLQAAAHALIEAEAARLPDLSRLTVLLPHLHAAPDFAQALARTAGRPLLLPNLSTLPLWAKQVALDRPLAPQTARQSLLYAALRSQQWFATSQLWPMTQELLTLFDELTLHRITLPESEADFMCALESAYETRAGEALQFEARLVHSLWRALRQDLSGTLDAASAYAMQLAHLARAPQAPLYGVGLVGLAPVETEFLTRYAEHQAVTLYAADTQLKYTGLDALLETAWTEPDVATPPLKDRAALLRATLPHSPIADCLSLFGADSLEQEAQAAATQVRLWLAEGKHRIALVAQDRLSARRVRAVLERHEVLVKDETGWTFSTTAASSLIMRWLDLIADDFYYQDLLDFLKSPLVFGALPREDRREAVAALELLIREHNVVSRLPHYHELARANDLDACLPLLETLDQARAGWQTRRGLRLAEWLQGLQQTLRTLGIFEPLARDLAGGQLLEMLQRAELELTHATETYRFAEWRHWLNQRFENATFLDTSIDSPVIFTHLPATRLRRFDAVLLLGCDATHLPAAPSASVFFNQQVRQQLGLPTWREAWRIEQQDVVGLLARTPAVLVTWQAKRQGEPNLLSPWFELLDACHQQAYGTRLINTRLPPLIEPGIVPAQPPQRPAPTLPPELIPGSMTASAYNSLMNCPYQYFARHVLRLNELDEVQLAMEKRDFGTLVHRILHTFHRQIHQVSVNDRHVCEAKLMEISEHVFSPLLRLNYLSRAWLTQWERLIPVYLDWQTAREQAGWSWQGGEQSAHRELALQRGAKLSLKGTMDRLDKSSAGLAVIDYKMRDKNALKQQLQTPGEDVQLPVYALLAGDAVAEAAYLSLHRAEVSLVRPEGDISELAQQAQTRLIQIFDALHTGAGLPAQGDEATCTHCEMAGLCRRMYWPDETEPTHD